jgi:hypothetical protein
MKLSTSDKVYVAKSKIPNAGRGVFTSLDIKKGDVIEKCPIIEVPEGGVSGLKESTLVTYFFYFGKRKERLAIALGFGSIYNHSYKPNAIFKIKPKERVIEFIALRDIKKDDEITFDYQGGDSQKGKKNPLWFEA